MEARPYKVAYMEPGNARNLYSRFFESEDAAREFLTQCQDKGMECLLFKKGQLDPSLESEYGWELMSGGRSRAFLLGQKVSSPKVWIPVLIMLGLFLILRKNNGLPNKLVV
jgi:hypothetical protein